MKRAMVDWSDPLDYYSRCQLAAAALSVVAPLLAKVNAGAAPVVDRSTLQNQITAALEAARNRGFRHSDEADTGDLVDAVMGPVDEWDDALHDDLKDEVARLRYQASHAQHESQFHAENERRLRAELATAREKLAASQRLHDQRDTIERERIAKAHLRMAEVNEAYIDVDQRLESAERERDAAMAARDEARAQVRILALDAEGQLGYLRPSDEWMNLGEPLNDDLQDAAHGLVRAGLLPEFERFMDDETPVDPRDELPEDGGIENPAPLPEEAQN
jgi:hypothetical protein